MSRVTARLRRIPIALWRSTRQGRDRTAERWHTVTELWEPSIGKIQVYLYNLALLTFGYSLASSKYDLSESSTRWALVGGLTFYSLVISGTTIASLPKFGMTANRVQIARLKGFGRGIYQASGLVTPAIAYSMDEANSGLIWLTSAAILVNAIGMNYCLIRWNYASAAQRDIGKMLFRIPMMAFLLAIALAFGVTSVQGSVALGLSILLVPLTFEVILVIHKSKPTVWEKFDSVDKGAATAEVIDCLRATLDELLSQSGIKGLGLLVYRMFDGRLALVVELPNLGKLDLKTRWKTLDFRRHCAQLQMIYHVLRPHDPYWFDRMRPPEQLEIVYRSYAAGSVPGR